MRLSIWRRIHICRKFDVKQSLKRPVLRKGFPKHIQIHKGVVIVASIVSQMMSAMALASSNSTMTYFSCRPPKASALCSLHAMATTNQVSGASFKNSLVAVQVNHGSCRETLCHFASSRHVVLVSWLPVPAVTRICGWG